MLPHELVGRSLRSTRETAGLARMLSKSIQQETNYDYAMYELSTPILPEELEEAANTLNEFVASHFIIDTYAGPGSGDMVVHEKRNMTDGTEFSLIQAGDDSESYMYPAKNREWESSYWVEMVGETGDFNNIIYHASRVQEAVSYGDIRASAYTAAVYKRLRRKDVLVSLKMIRHIYQRRLNESGLNLVDVLNPMVIQYLHRTVRQLSDLGLVYAYSWLLANRMDYLEMIEEEFLLAKDVTQEVVDELTAELEAIILSE